MMPVCMLAQWHQATVHYASCREPGDALQRWVLNLLGFFMVVLQCAACCGVAAGARAQSCYTNDQCTDRPGRYCGLNAGKEGLDYLICKDCGDFADARGGGAIPLQIDQNTGLIYNIAEKPQCSGEVYDVHPERCAELQRMFEENDMTRPVPAVDFSGEFNKSAVFEFCSGKVLCGYEMGLGIATGLDLKEDMHDWTYRCRSVEVHKHVARWCDACVHPVSGANNLLFGPNCLSSVCLPPCSPPRLHCALLQAK